MISTLSGVRPSSSIPLSRRNFRSKFFFSGDDATVSFSRLHLLGMDVSDSDSNALVVSLACHDKLDFNYSSINTFQVLYILKMIYISINGTIVMFGRLRISSSSMYVLILLPLLQPMKYSSI